MDPLKRPSAWKPQIRIRAREANAETAWGSPNSFFVTPWFQSSSQTKTSTVCYEMSWKFWSHCNSRIIGGLRFWALQPAPEDLALGNLETLFGINRAMHSKISPGAGEQLGATLGDLYSEFLMAPFSGWLKRKSKGQPTILGVPLFWEAYPHGFE